MKNEAINTLELLFKNKTVLIIGLITILSSILTNIIHFIKWMHNRLLKKKFGRSTLIAERYKRLYIPLGLCFDEVMVESCQAFSGSLQMRISRFLQHSFLFIQRKDDFKKVKKWFRYIFSPQLSNKSYSFTFSRPSYIEIKGIINRNAKLVDEDLDYHWGRIQNTYLEHKEYSSSNLEEELAKFVIYVRVTLQKMRNFLEKNHPELLAEG